MRIAVVLAVGLWAHRAAAFDADAEVRRLLQQQYGCADPARCTAHVGGVAYALKVVQREPIATPDGDRLYVLVAGHRTDERATSHAATGLVGAFVLEARHSEVELVAGSKAMPYGSFGAAPETARLRRLGPDHYWGWLYETGYTGQGITAARTSILLPYGRRIAELGNVPAHTDNEGAYPCDDAATRAQCESFDFDLQIDTARRDAKVYPLILTRTGTKAGTTSPPTTWHIGFDEKRWRYAVPDALKAD